MTLTKPQVMKIAATGAIFLGITVSPAAGITLVVCAFIVVTA